MFELNLKENIEFGIIKDLTGVSASRICGFIVYSLKHANVAKVVRDEDYWNELNAISGPNWPIFCVRPLYENSFGRGGMRISLITFI